MPKKKRKTLSQASVEFGQKQKQKKKQKWQRRIKNFQSIIDKGVTPRYKALESQFLLQSPKSKRKTVKKKKPKAKYYIYKGKAYPIHQQKKRK